MDLQYRTDFRVVRTGRPELLSTARDQDENDGECHALAQLHLGQIDAFEQDLWTAVVHSGGQERFYSVVLTRENVTEKEFQEQVES